MSRFSPDGTLLLWSSFLGGEGEDVTLGAALAGSRTYVTGITASADFPVAGGFDTAFSDVGRIHKAYVAQVEGTGALGWSSYLGGSIDDHGRALAVDTRGGVFVGGNTTSPDFPSTGEDPSPHTAFVTRVVSEKPAIAWSLRFGGSMSDTVFGVAAGDSGHVFAVGEATSADFPATAGLDTTLGGTIDVFIARIDDRGDGTCAEDERCDNCPADCGPCPAPDSGSEPAVPPPPDMGLAAAPRDGCGCSLGRDSESPLSAWTLALLSCALAARARGTVSASWTPRHRS